MDQREPLKGADQGEARLHSSLRCDASCSVSVGFGCSGLDSRWHSQCVTIACRTASPHRLPIGATSRLADHRHDRAISECGAWVEVAHRRR